MVENSTFRRTYSLLTSSRPVPYTGRHEGVCAPSVLDFVLCQTLISPFVPDTEEYDAEGHGRRR